MEREGSARQVVTEREGSARHLMEREGSARHLMEREGSARHLLAGHADRHTDQVPSSRPGRGGPLACESSPAAGGLLSLEGKGAASAAAQPHNLSGLSASSIEVESSRTCSQPTPGGQARAGVGEETGGKVRNRDTGQTQVRQQGIVVEEAAAASAYVDSSLPYEGESILSSAPNGAHAALLQSSPEAAQGHQLESVEPGATMTEAAPWPQRTRAAEAHAAMHGSHDHVADSAAGSQDCIPSSVPEENEVGVSSYPPTVAPLASLIKLQHPARLCAQGAAEPALPQDAAAPLALKGGSALEQAGRPEHGHRRHPGAVPQQRGGQIDAAPIDNAEPHRPDGGVAALAAQGREAEAEEAGAQGRTGEYAASGRKPERPGSMASDSDVSDESRAQSPRRLSQTPSHNSQGGKSMIIHMAQMTDSPSESPAAAAASADKAAEAAGAAKPSRSRTDSGNTSTDSVSLAASLFTEISHISDEAGSAGASRNASTGRAQDGQPPGAGGARAQAAGVGSQVPQDSTPACGLESSRTWCAAAGVRFSGAHALPAPERGLQAFADAGSGKAQRLRGRSGCVLRYACPPPSLLELRQSAEALNANYLASVRPGETVRLPVPEVVYSGAFYSKPQDVPREEVKFAGRVFHVGSSDKSFLPEFESAMAGDTARAAARVPAGRGPAAAPRSPHLQRTNCDGGDPARARGGRARSFIVRPLRQAPTRKATVRWLRAQERKKAGAAARSFETAEVHIDSAGRLCFNPAADVDGDSDMEANTPLGDSLNGSLSRKASRQVSDSSSKHKSSRASADMISDLLDRRPPSPRYDESFMVAASFEPMSQRTGVNLWSQDSDYSAFAESPAKPPLALPSSARMRNPPESSAPAAAPSKTSGVPEASARAAGEGAGGAAPVGAKAPTASRKESKSQAETGQGCGYELTMLSLEVQCESRRPNKGLPALNPDPRFDAVRAICYVIQVRV